MRVRGSVVAGLPPQLGAIWGAEPFASRDAAELFVDLARRAGSLSRALEYVRDPRPAILRKLLGMAPLPAPAQTPVPVRPGGGAAACGCPDLGVTFAAL